MYSLVDSSSPRCARRGRRPGCEFFVGDSLTPGRKESRNMHRLKVITSARITSWSPCGGWTDERIRAVFREHGKRSATPLEIAKCSEIPAIDRLWLLLRPEILPERVLRLFACWCADRALKQEQTNGREPDKRSWEAVRVARRFAADHATRDELSAAESSARSAARSAESAWSAWSATWSAAMSAARSAASAESAQLVRLIRVLQKQN